MVSHVYTTIGEGKPDKVSLQQLFSAAGVVSLDESSDAVSARGRSIRERGCVLRVTIFYENWYSTWLGTRYVCSTLWCTIAPIWCTIAPSGVL